MLRRGRPRNRRAEKSRPVLITLYPDDVRRLDALVEEVRARGLPAMSRSALIRLAVRHLRAEEIPEF